MPLQTYLKNRMLDQAITSPVYLSLHTATPSQGTPNEVTGGSPAYARKSATIGAASAGVRAITGTPITFDVPASTTVTHVGMWDASTAGNLLDYYDVTDEAFGAQGKADVNSYTLTLP